VPNCFARSRSRPRGIELPRLEALQRRAGARELRLVRGEDLGRLQALELGIEARGATSVMRSRRSRARSTRCRRPARHVHAREEALARGGEERRDR
jgi:hypothetical protein